jgi:hypothetical protein
MVATGIAAFWGVPPPVIIHIGGKHTEFVAENPHSIAKSAGLPRNPVASWLRSGTVTPRADGRFGETPRVFGSVIGDRDHGSILKGAV